MELNRRLQGRAVLVVEDEYYQAHEAKQALEDAGATVVGPFSDAAAAVSQTGAVLPDCALLDVNLGRGPNFAPARALMARGVPLIFLTGYDPQVIPEDLVGARFLQKPVSEALLIDAVDAAVRSAQS